MSKPDEPTAEPGNKDGQTADPPKPTEPPVSVAQEWAARKTASGRQGLLVGLIALVVVLAVVAAVSITLLIAEKSKEPVPSPDPSPGSSDAAGPSKPAGAQPNGGILLGTNLVPGGPAPSADEAVTVEVVTDLLCPWCNVFEQAHEQNLMGMAQAGEIRLVIHPVNNLRGFNDDYSWRALLALETVAAMEPDKFWDFYQALWEAQPEGHDNQRDDLTDSEIAQVANRAGVSQKVVDQFADSPVTEWARWSSDEGMKTLANVGRGTPSAMMSFAGSEPALWGGWLLQGTDENGQEVTVPGDLAGAIARVRGGEAPDAAPEG
ncbi:MAG: DsbA family protein [Bifidobacteriaceae bacterium]|nr:DsbA family protein [Bifidobacteriaceae bacterium]